MIFKNIILAGGMAVALLACNKENGIGQAEPFKEEVFHIFPKPVVSTGTSTGQQTGWVGDVMPYFSNGQFEIFFLHDAPDQVKQSSPGQHPIHKFSSKNLLDFSYDGEMIPYGSQSTQDHLVGTGSVVKAGNTNYFYYTGHNSSSNWLQNANPGFITPNTREAVMYATSSSLSGWNKKAGFSLVAPEGYAKNDFRDPFVFYNQEFAQYWMLVSTQKSGKGVILVYTSVDPASDQWDLKGPMTIEGDYLMLECADIFKIDDKYFMLFAEDWSSTPGTHYRVASSSAGPWLKPADGMDMFDGHQFYAARSASNGKEYYAFGWAHRRHPENDNGTRTWGGNLITQQLIKVGNDKLGVKSPVAVKSYFSKESTPEITGQSGAINHNSADYVLNGSAALASYRFASLNGTTMLKGNLSISNLTGVAGIGFNAENEHSASYVIKLEPAASRIVAYNNGNEVTRVPFSFEANKVYNFSIVLDGSVVVLYLNDQIALTNRIYSAKSNQWMMSADKLELKVNALKIASH
jgi:beta-fructofuranosidase